MATTNTTPTPQEMTQYRETLANLTNPSNTIQPVPTYGSNVVVNGQVVGQAKFDPNTGLPLSQSTTVSPSQTVTPVSPTTPTTKSYSVQAGDSLSKIAQTNGMTLQQLLDLNPSYKANPNMVQIGANLTLSGGSPVSNITPTNNSTVVDNTKVTDPSVIATQAGQAGLTPDQYNKIVDNSSSVTQAESDAIAKSLGIPALEGQLFSIPSQSSQQLYDQAYSTSGLSDIKAKIQALNDSIATDRSNLTSATAQIDENPFLIESSRVGRGKRILAQAESTINNKLDQIKQLQGVYDNGINEINGIISRNQADFNTNQSVNTAKLNYLKAKAESQITNLKASKVNSATDNSSYLSNTQGKAPSVVGSATTGYFTYDPTTKKFVQVSGANGGGSTTSTKGTVTSGTLTYTPQDQSEDSKALESSRGNDGFVDPTIYQNLYKAWVSNGGLLKDFLLKFPPKNYVNPANTWLPSYLMPTGTKKTTTTSGGITTDINAI